MRRWAKIATRDSHPLYKQFMRDVSNAIFLWNEEDLDILIKGMRQKLEEQQQLVSHLTDTQIRKRYLSRSDMLLHCRRVTRSPAGITECLEKLVAKYKEPTSTDVHGLPLVRPQDIDAVWNVQKQHVNCLIDPPDVSLYLKVSETKMGSVMVPVYRCGRGTTSLESFHKHVKEFIPGASASSENFQAYLLDGLHQWNTNRYNQLHNLESTEFYSYDEHLMNLVEMQRRQLGQGKLLTHYQHPRVATSKYILQFRKSTFVHCHNYV